MRGNEDPGGGLAERDMPKHTTRSSILSTTPSLATSPHGSTATSTSTTADAATIGAYTDYTKFTETSSSVQTLVAHAEVIRTTVVFEGFPETPAGKPRKLKFSEIPRRSKLTLVVMAVANFGAGCAFSLPAPFFPRE
ncbi:hypothetical protein ElyMa_001028400, partial [Elysia marginata]